MRYVKCPIHGPDAPADLTCGGEAVAAVRMGPTIEVDPCSSLIRQGWGNRPQAVVWAEMNRLEDAEAPAVVGGWRHRDGLVVLGGGA